MRRRRKGPYTKIEMVSDVEEASIQDENYVRNAKDECEPKPSLYVSNHLPEMIPSPFTRHDAGLVHPQSLNGDEFVMLAEKFGLGRRIGHVRE